MSIGQKRPSGAPPVTDKHKSGAGFQSLLGDRCPPLQLPKLEPLSSNKTGTTSHWESSPSSREEARAPGVAQSRHRSDDVYLSRTLLY